ncbi:MAG: hypothetical protein SVX43_06755 [Cyanobacteriota bacterium]|nr:hypothetical protein [Cyanobacteriota bacterium]
MMNAKSTPTHCQGNSSPKSLESPKDASEPLPKILLEEAEEFALPKPDPDNITVLTNKLPDKPILPWNRYDSPWREGEEEGENPELGETEARNLVPRALRDRESVGTADAQSPPSPQPEEAIATEPRVEEEEPEEPEIDEVE